MRTNIPSFAPGERLLGEVIAWTSAGVAVRHGSLVEALRDAGLDPAVARELAPRHAFTRACKKLSDQRIIRPIAEDEHMVRFQFTAEHRLVDRIEYQLETMLTLDKKTGTVSCDLPGLASFAQELLDQALEARTGSDVTRIIQKLFQTHADLFAIRPAGGCYFVPERHTGFVDKLQAFLGRLNGQVLRFPVQAGTVEGDRSVKEAVAAGLASLIEEHRQAVAQFGQDTREATLARAAEKIRETGFKISAYAEYLSEEKGRLDKTIALAREELRAKVAELAGAPVLA